MVDSIHVARWLRQFVDENVDFYIFPSGPNRWVHPQLRDLVQEENSSTYELHETSRFNAHLWLLDRLLNDSVRRFLLRRYLRLVSPDFVHAVEFQKAGYLTVKALNDLGDLRTPLLVTNYGSDIFWFGQFPAHEKKIKNLLKRADYYSAECDRDVALAGSFGFAGQILPTIPNSGGIGVPPLDEVDFDLAARNTVSIKGYDGWVGRARLALKALPLLAPELDGFRVAVFSANLRTRVLAQWLTFRHRIHVEVFNKNALTHSEILQLFRRSRIYVGISKSDGISTSMLEAMASGAIPVQTSTSCCNEWFTQTGAKVESLDVMAVANAIREGLRLAEDNGNARANYEVVRQRASVDRTGRIARGHYRTIAMRSTHEADTCEKADDQNRRRKGS